MGMWPKPRSLATVHSALSAKDLSVELRPPVARLCKVTVPSDTDRMSDGSTLQPFTTRVVRLGTALRSLPMKVAGQKKRVCP